MHFTRLIWTTLALISVSACQPTSDISELDVIDESLVNLTFQNGPYSVTVGDYDLPPSFDSLVLTSSMTDVRGRLFTPVGVGPFPLVVFLHGNHDTCEVIGDKTFIGENGSDFTETGKCPSGWTESPSFAGYDYLGRSLASHGFVVASMNANRGITASTKGVMIKERGRLVLRHLYVMQQWNEGISSDGFDGNLVGKINFEHVGFMGHSRGGEGVRAAYKFLRENRSGTYAPKLKNTKVEAVLEFAPVDKFTNEEFNVVGANWSVVIGTCDGDVYDYQGASTFHRRRYLNTANFSSVLAISGANHNFFNTEWQVPETFCDPGEKSLTARTQRSITNPLLTSYFRGFVGANKKTELQNIFDPQYRLPEQISSLGEIYRESWEGENATLLSEQDWEAEVANVVSKSPSPRDVARISYDQSGANYKSIVSIPKDQVANFDIISLGVSAKYDSTCKEEQVCENLDFSINLVYDDLSESEAVNLRDYAEVKRLPFSCLGKYSSQGWCEAPEITTSLECRENDGTFYSGKCYLRNSYPRLPRTPLFYEIPIEFRDFSYEQKDIIAIKFNFDRIPQSDFLFDRNLLLRKKL